MKIRYLFLFLFFAITASAALIPNHEQQIQISIQQQLIQLQNMNNILITRLMGTIWNDKTVNGCQVLTSMGTNAAALRNARVNFEAFINSQGGSITVAEPAGYTITNNEDGTVTCATPAPSPSPTPSP